MLRLLSKKESASAVSDFRVKMVEERNALSSEIAELTKKKNGLVQDIEKLDEESKTRSFKVESEHQGLKKTLLSEVTSLENRKKDALKPLTERERSVKEREDAVLKAQNDLLERRNELDDERHQLVDKRAELSDKEAEIKSKESSATYRLSKVQESEAVNRSSTAKLADSWQLFKEKTAEQMTRIENDRQDLIRREAEILKEKAWLVQERMSISNDRERIVSDRAAIKAAMKEMNITL